MTKPMPLTEFRAVRVILELEDFALGFDTPEPPPSDLIDKDAWSGIMTLPDDVAIRTSNRKGQWLAALYQSLVDWLKAGGDGYRIADILFQTMLDAHDEFDCSLFLATTGHYRQAIGCLRNALVMFGAYCQACNHPDIFKKWHDGLLEAKFGSACDGLAGLSSPQAAATVGGKTLAQALFEQRRKGKPGGWARELHGRLSDYAHSRPTYTNADPWQSNGPVFDDAAFRLTANLTLETAPSPT